MPRADPLARARALTAPRPRWRAALEERWGGHLLPALLIAGCAALVYAPGLGSPFLGWDDRYYVWASTHVQAPGWKGFFSLFSVSAALRDGLVEFFPLRDALYWALWQLFGANPLPFHLLSLGLHAAASVLVRALALRLGASRFVALAAGLAFATHPVHVESVTWVSALKDPLFLSLSLGALLAWLRFRESQEASHYLAAMACLVGALLSKSIAAPTVVLMVAAERLLGPQTPLPALARRAALPVALAAASLAGNILIARAAGVIIGPHGTGWWSHWQLAGWAYARYLQQSLAPATFRLHYCFPIPEGGPDAKLLGAAAALLATVAVGAWAWRKSRTALWLWLCFVAWLAPVLNLIPFPALMADRYLYAPTVATAIAVPWLLERLRSGRVLVAAIVLVFGAVTVARNFVWRSERALWEEVAGDDACWQTRTGHAFTGLLEWARVQPDGASAAAAWDRALRHPGRPALPEARLCQSFQRSALGPAQPTAELELRAAELQATSCRALPESWERLARASWRTRPDIAARALGEAHQRQPSPRREWDWGLGLLDAGDVRGAEHLARALEARPAELCPLFQEWAASPALRERPDLTAQLAARCPAPGK